MARSESRFSHRNAAILLLGLACLLTSPGIGHVNGRAVISDVSFDRLLHASGEPDNWLTYSGGYSGTRYSELAQITPANVQTLQLQWTLPSRDPQVHEEVTPLVVDGVIYTTQRVNDVAAVDAISGRTIWTFAYRPSPYAKNCCAQMTRGLAILGRTLFLATLDAHLIALDAGTGQVLWNTAVADPKEGYTFTHAPLVVKDKVVEGTAGGEFGIRGFVAAFDVHTGKEVWRFYTIPAPGEPGNDTWSGDSWRHGGAPVWITGSYDPESNLTYWGVGNPGPDYDGDHRQGDNLYSCAVIALDADTGKLKWYYQFSPHNEFDWDSAQIPVLADLAWKGRMRKLMLWANRNGVFYVLDRATGELLLRKPFVRVNWTGGLDAQRDGARTYPDELGATNWYSPSYNPQTGLFYVFARENSSSVLVKTNKPPEFRLGKRFSGIRPQDSPPDADSFSAIRAIDPATGDKKWDYRLGAARVGAGILTTASGILFSGSQQGSFRALDARNGRLLWQVNLDSPVSAAPITFSVAGKQYVSIQTRTALFTFGSGGGKRR